MGGWAPDRKARDGVLSTIIPARVGCAHLKPDHFALALLDPFDFTISHYCCTWESKSKDYTIVIGPSIDSAFSRLNWPVMWPVRSASGELFDPRIALHNRRKPRDVAGVLVTWSRRSAGP